MQEIREKMDWTGRQLFQEALPHCLSVPEASVVLIGVKNRKQLEEHLGNYKKLSSRPIQQA